MLNRKTLDISCHCWVLKRSAMVQLRFGCGSKPFTPGKHPKIWARIVCWSRCSPMAALDGWCWLWPPGSQWTPSHMITPCGGTLTLAGRVYAPLSRCRSQFLGKGGELLPALSGPSLQRRTLVLADRKTIRWSISAWLPTVFLSQIPSGPKQTAHRCYRYGLYWIIIWIWIKSNMAQDRSWFVRRYGISKYQVIQEIERSWQLLLC